MLLVHGGTQGSWAWERIAPHLAEDGWYTVCLNWFGHHGSAQLPGPERLSRSILDVTQEIGIVASGLARPPVLVGHSMGGLAALAYAASHPVAALVLLTPVVPRGFAGRSIPVPVDPDAPWRPPDAQVDALFWDEVDPADAARYRALIAPESPRAVLEATRWWLDVDVDVDAVTVPTFMVASASDLLVPAPYVESLAARMGARCRTLVGRGGHGVPLNPVWRDVADEMIQWCRATFDDQRAA
ncbi:MAG: alpha/beta hydrolase [Sciscionella sp.]